MAHIAKTQKEYYHLDTRKALSEHLFQNRENGFSHAPFEREMAFYESVRSGSLETVKTLFTPLGGDGFGTLSHDPLRNLKYHLVVSIAMVTRFCINGGMTPEEAYSLSDVFIQATDLCGSAHEINQVHYNMAIEFTKRMRQIRSGHVYSKTVMRMLDYISDHLHEKIRTQDLADFVSCTVPYISRLFHNEIGVPHRAIHHAEKDRSCREYAAIFGLHCARDQQLSPLQLTELFHQTVQKDHRHHPARIPQPLPCGGVASRHGRCFRKVRLTNYHLCQESGIFPGADMVCCFQQNCSGLRGGMFRAAAPHRISSMPDLFHRACHP